MILYDLINRHGSHFSPNSWRLRLALAHKGIPFEVEPVLFTNMRSAAGGRVKTIPSIQDGDEVLSDSWLIVQYLDRKFPDTPRMIPDGADGRVLQFLQYWVQTTVHAGIVNLILHDAWRSLEPADQDYFRASREKTFGKTLEQVQQGRDERIPAFRNSLQPLRMMLADAPFIGGAAPSYADYMAFAGFQWARITSPVTLLKADDPLHAWVERCLDLHGGLARSTPAFPG